MRIHNKLLAAFCGLFALLALGSYTIERGIVLRQFDRLERSAARDDLQRCREVILRELEHLEMTVRDWAFFDDTYAFMADRNDQFVAANLNIETLQGSEFHIVYLVDAAGRVAWAHTLAPDLQPAAPLKRFPIDCFPPDHSLRTRPAATADDDLIRGVLTTELAPLLVCAGPVLTSEQAGPPRGTLIIGRFLSPSVLNRLRLQTRVDFDVVQLEPDHPSSAAQATLTRLPAGDGALIDIVDDQTLLVSGALHDERDQPSLLIQARIPRAISLQGKATVRRSLVSIVIIAALACAAIVLLVRRIVIQPLERLTRETTRIGRTGDLSVRLMTPRADEIGTLSREFDRMISSLSEARNRLVETSRQAGMADVAAGVLHNVGNMLNTVNTSAAMITEGLRTSRMTGLRRVAELLDQHRTDLGAFITQDERGRMLPAYLGQLAQALADEHHEFMREIDQLKIGVDNVNQIVQAQSIFANRVEHVEPAPIAEVIEAALAIMTAAFQRHAIQVQCTLSDVPTAWVDRAKLTQVLISLLTNAKDALQTGSVETRQVVIRLQRLGADRLQIEITDNGAGIAPEDQARLFTNGFTTKPRGRGFGLHFCALAIHEMGGAIRMASAGRGQGATITLELPLHAVEALPA